jgi:hypothetical protein
MHTDLDYRIANTYLWSYDSAADIFLTDFSNHGGSPTVSKAALDEKNPRLYAVLKYMLSKWAGQQCARALKMTIQFWDDPHAILYSGFTAREPCGPDDYPCYVLRFFSLLSEPDHSRNILFDVEYCDMERLVDGTWFSTGAWAKLPQVFDRALLESRWPGSIARMQVLLALGESHEKIASQVFRSEGPVEVVSLPDLNDPETTAGTNAS